MTRGAAVLTRLLTAVFFLSGAAVANAQCVAPTSPAISFAPPNVGVGQTYVVTWTVPSNLDATGVFIVERSINSNFSPILDSQRLSANYASFLATSQATFFHRVRAIQGCDPTKISQNSAAASSTAVFGRPSVVFTVQPRPVITTLGDALTNYNSKFKLENLTQSDVTVNIFGAGSFFRIFEPGGSDSLTQITLPPRSPREYEIRFFNVSATTEAAYQGVFFLQGLGGDLNLTITPYAFVNLKIGGNDTATPVFLRSGKPVDYLFFPGFSGSDSARPAQSITIQNPGAAPMQVAGDIGPEVWLSPVQNWNATAIQPGGTKDVDLKTDRSRAPTGSALPRYTYFTVRTKSGQSARLLVQDNDAASLTTGRGAALDKQIRTFVVPYVVSSTFNGNDVYSRVRLSNAGNQGTQKLNVEIYFTPTGSNGSDSAVKRAVIVVPSNDVVSLTDPLQQIFGLPAPAAGQLEVRTDADKIGLLSVSSTVLTVSPNGGNFTYPVPVATRGEGAALGLPQSIAGVTSNAFIKSDLVLAETTGLDSARVLLTVIDSEGASRGTRRITLAPYGFAEISDVLLSITGANLEAAQIQLTVETGAGAVIGIAKVLDTLTNGGSTISSQPTSPPVLKALAASGHKVAWGSPNVDLSKFVIPGVLRGPVSGSQPGNFTTNLMLAAPIGKSAAFTVSYIGPNGTPGSQVVQVGVGKSVELKDVLKALFGFAATAQGTITVEGPLGSRVNATLQTDANPPRLAAAIPVVPTTSDAVTGGATNTQRPLLFDGLEQSTDATRGTRWIGYINEISGQPVTVRIRLYEAGNRSYPIAESTIALQPFEQRKLDSIFSELGLDTADRRKDRTNVLMVIAPESGAGLLTASLMALDPRSKDTQVYLLTPTGGISPTGLAGRITAAPPEPPNQTRRRGVRRAP